MTKPGDLKLADAVVDPQSVFASPAEVVRHDGISLRDKRTILDAWKEIETARRDTDTKGSQAGGSLLGAIDRAIAALD